MRIEYDDRFVDKFLNILQFVAQDSTQHAEKFEQKIKEKISNIPDFLYACRKSIYFEDDTIRDMIYKGYCVVYKVDTAEDRIIVLGIVKYQQKI